MNSFLLAKFPNSVINFNELSVLNELGFATKACAYTARSRGTFPVRVRQIGKKLVIFRDDLVEYLSTGKQQKGSTPLLVKRSAERKAGRPTKAEQVEAKRAGFTTVAEFRASKAGDNHA